MSDPSSATLEAAKTFFLRGLEAHQTGNLIEAERAFREALALAPDRPSVLTNLGLVLLQAQKFDEAEAILRKKAAVENNGVESLLALGDCLTLREKIEDALRCYLDATQQQPDSALAQGRAGRALLTLGRSSEALAHFERALVVEPQNTYLLLNRGTILYEQGHYAASADCYETLLTVEPDHLEALNSRVIALAALGRYDEALTCAGRAITLAPDDVQSLCNHGNILADLQRYPDALASFDQALRLQPHDINTLGNRAVVLIKLLRYDDAVASFHSALAIVPDHLETQIDLARLFLLKKTPAEALSAIEPVLAQQPEQVQARTIRGDALLALGRAAEALAEFDRVLALNPGDPDLLNRRCNTLLLLNQPEALIECYERLLQVAPDYDYALGCLLHAKLNCCDWRDYDDMVQKVREAVQSGKRADLPFTFLAVSDSAADQLQCARLHAAHDYPLPAQPLWRGEIYRHDKIRVAYLSADFHEHATAYLMAGLFEAHDAKRFEVTAISFGPETGDAMRSRLKHAFARFIDVQNLSDYDVAARLRELEIDIAVDLKGYTQQHRAGILAYRPVPIQINYLGYPGTMGADFVDYIIADATVIPPSDRVHYTEKVVYLPDSYQVNDAGRKISSRMLTRAAADLPRDGIVFCCFNNHYKIIPAVFDCWMRILTKVKGSVLWLLAGHEVAMCNLRLEAQRRGVAPERLVFAPRMKLEDHLARHRLADIFLDTLPYNAHTTASDALWAGLPVVTCGGTTFAGRVAASLLTAAQMPELITDTMEQYEALALQLATQSDTLAKIKAKLGSRFAVCPLFNTGKYCRHLETAYTMMHERYSNGAGPQAFTVTG